MTVRALPQIPNFKDEAEEAQWWFEHRDALSDDILAAAKNGTLGEGSLARASRKQKESSKHEPAA